MKVTEFETIANDIGLGFLYGNAAEINQMIDNEPPSSFPILVYIAPITVTDTIEKNNLVRSKFPFTGAVLDKLATGNETIDFASSEVQSLIDSTRDKARKFIFNVNAHEMIDDQTQGIEEVSYPSTYSEHDDHLFGVTIEATISVTTGSTFC